MAITGLISGAPAHGRGFCSEPIAPFCVSRAFSTTGAAPATPGECRADLHRHLKNLVLYQTCLLDQAAEIAKLVRKGRGLLDCDHNPTQCDGLPD